MDDDRRRVRLTQEEWEAELERAADVMARDVDSIVGPPRPSVVQVEAELRRTKPEPLIVRTGRRRPRWMRGWRR